MKILHIVPSYKPAYVYGGPIVVIAQLAETLAQFGHQVTVYTTTANGPVELNVIPNQPQDVDGVTVYYFSRVTKEPTMVSIALWKHLDKTVNQFDVVHIHSWWNFLALGAAWVCKKNNVRPILSPHGMFSDYIITTNNAFFKQAIHLLVAKRLLKNTFLHVSTDMEWDESQKIVPNWVGRVIPNMVTLSRKEYTREKNSVFTIGFLSRIDPKKGVDILIDALSRVSFLYRLLIAGSGDNSYIQFLKEFAEKKGNGNRIEWVGWKNEASKFDLLASLDLFALTSHSENFAVVVIESLSVGTPVLVSNNVGLHTFVEKKNYGWVTSMSPELIANQLNVIVEDHKKRDEINCVAPQEIKEEFDTESIMSDYVHYYDFVNKNNNYV